MSESEKLYRETEKKDKKYREKLETENARLLEQNEKNAKLLGTYAALLGDLTKEDLDAARRLRGRTRIVLRDGVTRHCALCGAWLGGIREPAYCPRCGRPFGDEEKEQPAGEDGNADQALIRTGQKNAK